MAISTRVAIRRLYQSLIAALTIVLIDAGSASGAPPTPVTACNTFLTVPGDYVLVANLTCSSTAIIIDGDNVRFNLNGFFLAGEGSGAGIEVSFASNVRIRGGTIRHFGNGIRLDTSDKVRVNDMVLVGNVDGVQLHDSDNNRITDSQITTNTIGVRIEGSHQNIVSDNTISNNVADPLAVSAGVLVQNASTGNVISTNILASNGSLGVTLQDASDSNLIENNTVSNTSVGSVAKPGITVIGSSLNTVRGNTVTGNSFGIEIAPGVGTATGNLIQGNTANSNEQGILILGGATSNTIQLNTATGSSFVDLNDANSGCDANVWTTNTFVTDLVAGLSDGGPGVGCIQ